MLVSNLMNTLNLKPCDVVYITTKNGDTIISDNTSAIDLAFDPCAHQIITAIKCATVQKIDITHESTHVKVIICTNITEYDYEVLRGAIS